MNTELKFLNDIAKPWDELNSLLVQRYAFQPDLSSVTTMVAAISTAIKHQVDILALIQNHNVKNLRQEITDLQQEVDRESEAARLISDVSDVAKHVQLGKPARQNNVFVAAMFEVNTEGNFRFIRNGVFVNHSTLGCRDFMQTSLTAIEYWSHKRGINISWTGSVSEAKEDFLPTAFLHFNPKYCINMASTQIQFFCRDDLGNLQPFDPKEVRFEVR